MFRKDSKGETTIEWPAEKGAKRTFALGRILGKGGFGKCYEVTCKQTGVKLACKIIDKGSDQYRKTKQKVQTQITIHRKMKHPNIVRFEDCFEDDRHIYILLELCSNNTLDDVMNRRKHLSEIEVRYYLRQILEGVKYIHDQKIVHRDLKLQNFFISDNLNIKIGDFGLAESISLHRKRRSICGTPNYMAPQVFSSKDGYSLQVDIWSLGVTAYLLLSGRFPFEKQDSLSVASEIKSKAIFYRTNVSIFGQSLVNKMLLINPGDRSTVKQLLKHQFFTSFSIPESLPLSCLICQPTLSFIRKYKDQKVCSAEEMESDNFQFLLESKESPTSQQEKKIVLNYQQINSISDQKEEGNLVIPKVCSFGYESKKNQTCLIKKWILQCWDMPNYGVLYRLSDGVMGMRFNDGTNMKLIDKIRSQYSYIPLNGKNVIYTNSQEANKSIPKEVKLKMTILAKQIQGKGVQECTESGQNLYLRLAYNSLGVFLIWLSNGMLQGKFQDGSELIIGIDSCMYINETKTKSVYPSKNFSEQEPSILSKKKTIEEVVRRISKLRKQGAENKENNY